MKKKSRVDLTCMEGRIRRSSISMFRILEHHWKATCCISTHAKVEYGRLQMYAVILILIIQISAPTEFELSMPNRHQIIGNKVKRCQTFMLHENHHFSNIMQHMMAKTGQNDEKQMLLFFFFSIVNCCVDLAGRDNFFFNTVGISICQYIFEHN